MKRFFGVTIGLLFALTLLLPGENLHAQNVQSFYFSSFTAEYRLSLDDDGRSRMLITETLVAEFPEFNQNKGLVRNLPITLNGRPLSFELEELTRNGEPEPLYDKSTSGGMVTISTGTDHYVLGTQEYQFVYSLRDVTLDFGDYQELFWNVNGTEWRQKFDSVSATVILDNELQNAFTGELVCFEGPEGSRNECTIVDNDETGAVFASTRSLGPGENVSFALKFAPGTFAPYEEPAWSVMLRSVLSISAIAASLLATFGAVRIYRKHRDRLPGQIIPREYLPIKELPILKAAVIYGKQSAKTKAVTAQLLELAVQRKINLIEAKADGSFGRKKTTYEIEIKDLSSTTKEELAMLSKLMQRTPKPSMKHPLSKSDTRASIALQKYQEALKKKIVEEGYREKRPTTWPLFMLAIDGVMFAIIMVSYSSSIGFTYDFSDVRFWSLPVAIIASILTVALLSQPLKRPTEKGREVINHFKGLDEYIKLAEAERLRFHQSPEGARRQKINSENKEELVRLYERLLPYAVVLGHEKDWFRVIGQYYEEINQRPAWYVGSSSFSASRFTSAMNSISTTATSSTSSGFSGGGGSGGGGGGGGGGGR